MELVTGYAGKAHIQADDLRELYAGIIGNDTKILPVGNRCKLSMKTANEFTISDGSMVIQGAHFRIRPGNTETVTITNGTVGEKRHDLIVVRYERNNASGIETATLMVKKGISSKSPTDPAVVTGNIRAGDLVHEEPIYRIILNEINIEKTECLISVAPSIQDIPDKIYPVGAIYMSVNATDPGELFGGRWKRWGSGRVPVGIDVMDEDFNTAEKTGGVKSVDLQHKHTTGMGYDENKYYATNKYGTTVLQTTDGEGYTFNVSSARSGNVRVAYTDETLGNVTNLQPYITCYMWVRVE